MFCGIHLYGAEINAEFSEMQNFPNNIVLTSLCYYKYYTMCRCLSMSVMPVKAARFVRGACSQFPL